MTEESLITTVHCKHFSGFVQDVRIIAYMLSLENGIVVVTLLNNSRILLTSSSLEDNIRGEQYLELGRTIAEKCGLSEDQINNLELAHAVLPNTRDIHEAVIREYDDETPILEMLEKITGLSQEDIVIVMREKMRG